MKKATLLGITALLIGVSPGVLLAAGPTGQPLSSVTHDATLNGSGTSTSPLSVVSPYTGVTHDATLTGNGTAASPLGVVPPAVPPLTGVTHDATLQGAGTSTSPLQVVPPAVPPLTGVTHDSSLTGNGTAASPLQVVTPAAFNSANGNLIALTQGDCCEQQSTTLETVSLSPGSYVINAVVVAASGDVAANATFAVQCKLRGANVLRYGNISSVLLNAVPVFGAQTTLPVTASVTLTVPDNVSVVCWQLSAPTTVFGQRVSLTAIQVQTLLSPSIVVH